MEKGEESMRNNCMFKIPHELSGCGSFCVLLKNNCNDYGKNCIAYKAHNKESRAALAEAIEIKKKKREVK